MSIRKAILLGLVLVGGGLPLSARSHATTAEVSAAKGNILEGNWKVIFGEKPIEFWFAFEDGSWKAWFVSQKDGSLYPIKDVEVDGDTVSFTNVSKPEVTFLLKLDKNGNSLSGIKTFPDGTAVAQTLQRL